MKCSDVRRQHQQFECVSGLPIADAGLIMHAFFNVDFHCKVELLEAEKLTGKFCLSMKIFFQTKKKSPSGPQVAQTRLTHNLTLEFASF